MTKIINVIVTIVFSCSSAFADNVGEMVDAGMSLHDAIEAAHGGLDGDFNPQTNSGLYPGSYWYAPNRVERFIYTPTWVEQMISLALAISPIKGLRALAKLGNQSRANAAIKMASRAARLNTKGQERLKREVEDATRTYGEDLSYGDIQEMATDVYDNFPSHRAE